MVDRCERTHKHNQSSLCIDELLKSRPVVLGQSPIRMERIVLKTRALKGGVESLDGDGIAVGQKQRHDLVGVAVHPGGDFSQVLREGSGIQLPAVRVAHLNRAMLAVRLGLQEAHAEPQLIRHGNILIVDGRGPDKGAVVAANKRHLGIFLSTELSVAIARCDNCSCEGQKLQKLRGGDVESTRAKEVGGRQGVRKNEARGHRLTDVHRRDHHS